MVRKSLSVLLSTGRVKRSFDVGFAGFMLTTLGSWYVLTFTDIPLFFLHVFHFPIRSNALFSWRVEKLASLTENQQQPITSMSPSPRFYCRMSNAKLRVQQRMIQDGIKNKVVYEGTVLDPANKGGSETPSGSS